jgi:hypothetical protein
MADPASAKQPDEDQPPLLHFLDDLGGTLTQSELPSPSKLLHVVGAMVKVMDHAGVQVADELYPEEPEPVARPETAAAVHQAKTNTRLDQLEGILERVLGHLEDKSPAADAPPVEEEHQ